MSKTITVHKAKEALQHLRKLTPANPKLDDDLEMSIKELVFFMAPDLIQMSKRGFTIKELSDGLAAEGVVIKPGTLNRYLNEYLSSKEGTTKSEAEPVTGVEPGATDPTPPNNPGNEIEDHQSDSTNGIPETSSPKSESLKPQNKATREKSDSPPQNQGHPSPVNKE